MSQLPTRQDRPFDRSPESRPDDGSSLQSDGEERRFDEARRNMVETQLRGRDIVEPRVLEAMLQTPRHRFVPPELQDDAYADRPLSIGHKQTISQPYVVALMSQLAMPNPEHRALDVGAGSGYQAAVLSRLCKHVYSIEIVPELAALAERRLRDLGYANISVSRGDGYRGWPEQAPFDVIIAAAAPTRVPQPLVEQLAPGGRLVIPVGGHPQQLLVVEKRPNGSIRTTIVAEVAFVPMTGEAGRSEHG